MNLTPQSLKDEDLEGYFSSETPQIIGFGSLLSPRSARTTFPNLTDFRVVRVEGYRRIFRHPASIFFERGIADIDTLRISSLCAEKADGCGFLATAFQVKNEGGEAFLKREEEFGFDLVLFKGHKTREMGLGLMCVASTDSTYIDRWGESLYQKQYVDRELTGGIWGWDETSGLLPCSVYLRHCYLAAEAQGVEVLNSFLDETFLVDRTTTIRQYLEQNPDVLAVEPPPELVGRYSG